ncbi:MAG: hypothetical protein ACXWBO_16165, partial [Ilumatobacteraceae bacterium]
MKVIVGDFIHNVRSALDHQAAALVPIERRGETTFPIMFVGVWESPRPDDDGLMISQRKRRTKAVKGMDPDAVTILKRLQSNPVVHLSGPHISGGVILNRLSNLDKHDALIELSLRLLRPTFTASVGGDIVVSDVGFDPRDGLIDGAEFESLIDA